jgi:ABC-type antimicrobial peptide transport system permease subunit
MYFTYLRRELRRRLRQVLVVAAGLAIGIGLVMTVSSASAGVKSAQGEVLHSLYGVGTDITVTKAATAGSGGAQHFNFAGGGKPSAGAHVARETLRPTPGQTTLPSSDVATVASLPGASGATGGLVLSATSFSGTIPSPPEGGHTGPGAGAEGGSPAGGSSFSINTVSVDGVQISSSDVGPLSSSQVTQGSYFTQAQNTAKVAIVSSSYATQHDVKLGSDITVASNTLSVIGIAQVPSGGAEVYLPLGTAQSLSGLNGDVTTIFVSASSASGVSSLASSVEKAVPGSTVATSESLANQVSGSLQSASSLATSLGKWVSIAALAVAFVVAALLMMATVSRRVREFGTLKAIGWRTRRIVGQVMGEGLVIGIAGGLGGIVLGIAGAEVISAVSPSLSATTGAPAVNGAVASTFHHAADAAHTVLVHLSAPLEGGTIGIAVALALAGGLIAGAFGAWRAARMRPAAALRRIA